MPENCLAENGRRSVSEASLFREKLIEKEILVQTQ